ncbi:MAG: DNA repair protein RecN, partial [Pseudomonadota bacterium]
AIKAAGAAVDGPPTLIFDEVDSGVGGATAAAVGDRLARLAQGAQVLVVTHSPQVAARGAAHFEIVKATADGATRATTRRLPDWTARREEIARMLAGAAVTQEARAAADRLLHEGQPAPDRTAAR